MEAEAESSQANNLQSKRKHQQRMAKTDNLRMIMQDKNVIIGGDNAEQLLNYFNETGKLVDDPNE